MLKSANAGSGVAAFCWVSIFAARALHANKQTKKKSHRKQGKENAIYSL